MAQGHLDFETYSEAGLVYREGDRKWVSLAGPGATKKSLPLVGMYRYAEHPTTEVTCATYDLGYGKVLWVPGAGEPEDLIYYVRNGGVIRGFNVAFERLIWNLVMGRRWGYLPIEQTECTASRARAYNFPGQLGRASAVVGTHLKDSSKGSRVLSRFSVPHSPTKKEPQLRIRPEDDPAGAAELYEYNMDDVDAEKSVHDATPPLSDFERRVWTADQYINLRGIPVDVFGVEKCLQVLDVVTEWMTQELQQVTGGVVKTASEIQKIQGWLAGRGVYLDSLDAEGVERGLDRLQPHGRTPERRVLEIRQALSGAGVKKLRTLQYQTCSDNRLRGAYIYGGADTLRWSSEGVQTHNLKSAGPALKKCDQCRRFYSTTAAGMVCPYPDCGHPELSSTQVEWCAESAEFCVMLFTQCSPEFIVHVLGSEVIEAMGSCLRALFQTPEGHEFICSDYSAIEAVVLAQLAGEEWRLEVFRTHGKIYETCVADLTGLSLEEQIAYKKVHGQHHPYRKKFGKIPELASGYQGWINAWKKFGADKLMSDEEIKAGILKWREKSPNIVELWGGQFRRDPSGSWDFTPELYGLEGAWIAARLNPGVTMRHRYIAYTYDPDRDLTRCHLPSGRDMIYHKPTLRTVRARTHDAQAYQLSYWKDNTNSTKGAVGWAEVETYGGSLTENVCQAVSRDIFANGMLNVEAGGYPVVLHTHDELAAEVSTGYGSIEDFEARMGALPAWAHDWPIKVAGGWRGRRYRKE